MNGYGWGTLEGTVGITAESLASQSLASPYTSAAPAIATTDTTDMPAHSPIKRLLDPKGSAAFWIFVAAILGLALVSGELKVAAALGGRLGK